MNGAEAATVTSYAELISANVLASQWWARQDSTPIPSWLHSRGLPPRAVTNAGFAVGHAPNEWDAMSTVLQRHGFPARVGLAAGLLRARQSNDGVFDGFRDRAVFTIKHIATGQPLGFTARTLDTNPNSRAPKYLNSPANQAFSKGCELFGGWEAKHSLYHGQSQRALVVCEGPMDVLACAVAGYPAVAACGTALTATQAQWIAALAKGNDVDVILAYDGDEAGQMATRTAASKLRPHLIARYADLGPTGDPASVGSGNLTAALSSAVALLGPGLPRRQTAAPPPHSPRLLR